MSVATDSAGGGEQAGARAHRPASRPPRPITDPAQRGAAPLSPEAKRRVRFAENQRKGFESAWNEYFDCYASTTYVEEPLIRLEDVSYHLYLKKHINPTNPHWELPSFRQLKRILGLSQDKLQGIEARLATARLLVKDSGKGKGAKGENVANDYLLYEPLELADFLLAVAHGDLPGTLNEKGRRKLAEIRARFCPDAGQRAGGAGGAGDAGAFATVPGARVPEIGTPGVADSGTGGGPEIGTGPAPDSGTQNTRRPTNAIQQTQQQQAAGAASGRGDAVVVVARPDDALRAGTAAAPSGALPDPLVERGITPLVARRLRQGCPAERIARQIAAFDWLRGERPDDPKLTPGRLRRQIEEDWAAPAGFVMGRPGAAGEGGQRETAIPAGEETARRMASAAAARRARLAAVGLSEADQALWARIVQAAPVLPPLFRAAYFHAPQGDGPAAVIFADRADCARAQAPAHAASRARIAARLAATVARPAAGTPGGRGIAQETAIRFLAYDDLLALVRGNE